MAQVTSPGINGRGGTTFDVEGRGTVVCLDQELSNGRKVETDLRPREALDLGIALIEAARPYVKTKNRLPMDIEQRREGEPEEEPEPRHSLRQKR